MSRLQQNIIYAGILIAVIGFFWAIVPKTSYDAHGLYLPQTDQKYASISASSVNFYPSNDMNVAKAVPVVNDMAQDPIGIIRVDTHYSSKNEIKAACEQNVQKAKALAAKNGAKTIIGNCISSGNVGPLDGANLYAYAYR